jgi:hypothetical protein
MFELYTSGTYYEMGYQIGESLKGTKIPGFPLKFSKKKLELGFAYEEVVKKFAPAFLEELKGKSDSLDVVYELLVASECSPWRNQPQCMVLAIAAQHNVYNKPILARNHEWIEEDAEYMTICHTKPKGKFESFGFTFRTSETSRYGGINKNGVAISSTSTNFNFPKDPGIMLNVAQRWILDNCKTTDEAVKYLEMIPKVWGNVYLVIDRNNTVAMVEGHYQRTKTTYFPDGYGLISLLFDSDEMLQYNSLNDWVKNVAPKRKKFVNDWFRRNRGDITYDLIKQMLKNHEHNVCDHSTDGKLNFGICWSWILTIDENNALISTGPPCKNTYKLMSYFDE